MVWQAIASGTNGIFFYMFSDVIFTGKSTRSLVWTWTERNARLEALVLLCGRSSSRIPTCHLK